MIAWSPYTSESLRANADILNAPMILFPKMHSAKGRWESRDKMDPKLLNIRPAFTLPGVPVAENGDKRSENYRAKRATGFGNPSVALCGGVFRDLYGKIESPEFPLYYPNNKQCIYDIELPSENYTVKVTCDSFIMQGGENCTHDYLMASPTGNSTFLDGDKYCGAEPPVILSTGNKMRLKFRSDDLFRYQGFSCRYRALQPNGIAVPGSFGNTTENTKPKANGNSFLQISQCPSVGGKAALGDENGSEGGGGGASLYSGLWNGMCGFQNLPPTNRIIGGFSTESHEFPWIAAVLRTCGSEYCQICGATIISEEWILTGAHCMFNVPKEELGILVGDNDLYSISNEQKFIRVKEKVVHPDFNQPTPLNNDIGLLRLETPIVFTKYISPLCLPAFGETGFGSSASGSGNTSMLDTTGLDIVGKNATVLGWGMINDDGVYAEALRGVSVEILDNDVCNKLYGIMTETMMCTSGSNGRSTCYGDSGGPAIIRQPDGTFVQVGILAFGALAGCEKGYPSGQVLVHKYIDWIQAVTEIAFGSQAG